MINLPLHQHTALNLATRIQKGIHFWENGHDFLEKDEIDRIGKLSKKISRKVDLFTDLEMAELPSVSFSIKECRLLGTLTNCCDRKLEKEFFKPMNQQLIALDQYPVIIRGYSEWSYMWKALNQQEGISTKSLDWILLYKKSDLQKGHLFDCSNKKKKKQLSVVIPFSKTFKRAMGMPL